MNPHIYAVDRRILSIIYRLRIVSSKQYLLIWYPSKTEQEHIGLSAKENKLSVMEQQDESTAEQT
jgi:hypothetical protein